jgi:hypothetical protein
MSNPYREHFTEVKKKKQGMITRQKYCVLCEHRYKGEHTGTICMNQLYKPITEAMKVCKLLKPFDLHKAQKGTDSE